MRAAVLRGHRSAPEVEQWRFDEASDGPTDLIIDPLYGAPAAAALRTARRYARLVQLGSSASETSPIDSGTLRSRSLCLLAPPTTS